MSPEDCANASIDGLKDSLRPAFDAYLGELRDEVREEIGVPVERIRGKVIRSKPGEPPRKETGDYSDSWLVESLVQNDAIEGHVYTQSKVGGYLINGTSRMAPRPHAEKSAEGARQNGGERIKAKL